ncbi:helix-turn-helix transcriptional regulator [Kineococcus terrestris]|uniref:helix-turn-helix transcriptional regulator n=1 Tax=Kineococcus terrestris TaxID=2044856 RepID=UPI0034DB1188
MDWQSAATAAGRIAGAVTQDAPRSVRAAEALEELRALVPFVGASIAAWDETTSSHAVVADSGYRDAQLAHLNGEAYLQDPTWHVTVSRRAPVPWRDMPFRPDESWIIRESLRPSGYREGMTAPFFRGDGSYAGMLTLNTDSATHPHAAAVEMLGLLSARMAEMVSGPVPPAGDGDAPEPGGLRIAVSASGVCTPLGGEPTPQELLAALRREVARGSTGFLVWERGERAPWHVRLPARGARPTTVATTVATAVRGPVPGSLSRRELEVLAGLTEGLSNQEIAEALHASRRTVSTHVEHILTKLGARSRTEAATRAVRDGLLLSA